MVCGVPLVEHAEADHASVMQVEETLKPKALAMGNGLTWEGMLGDLQPKQPWPSTAKLTAYALYDGTCTNDKAGEAP